MVGECVTNKCSPFSLNGTELPCTVGIISARPRAPCPEPVQITCKSDDPAVYKYIPWHFLPRSPDVTLNYHELTIV